MIVRRREEEQSMNDRDVTDAFIVNPPEPQAPGLPVDRRFSGTDAIAGCLVIEHTSIDTLPNQRRDSDWFMRAAGDDEEELRGRSADPPGVGV
jgi:hypothetical protein